MHIRDLEKRLRSAGKRNVPADLRDRLVNAIPEDFGKSLPVKTEPWRRALRAPKSRFALAAVAADVAFAVVDFIGGSKLGGLRHGLSGVSLSFVAAAIADIVDNLEAPGALYIELDLRTRRQEPFEFVEVEGDFSRITIWLERPSERFEKGRMRVEKKERKTVFDGRNTLFHDIEFGDASIRPGGNVDMQLEDPARWFDEHLSSTDVDASVDAATGSAGESIARLTLLEKGAELHPNSRPAFYSEFDRRTVISWDTDTKRMTDLERYVMHNGQEVMVAKLRAIDYGDRFEDEVFSHNLPESARMMAIADPENEAYSEMDPVEVATFFFNAWKNEEWDKVKVRHLWRFENLVALVVGGK